MGLDGEDESETKSRIVTNGKQRGRPTEEMAR